jgi:hypothetical protein
VIGEAMARQRGEATLKKAEGWVKLRITPSVKTSDVLAKIQPGNLPDRDPEHCLYSSELGVIRQVSRVAQHDCWSANKETDRFRKGWAAQNYAHK